MNEPQRSQDLRDGSRRTQASPKKLGPYEVVQALPQGPWPEDVATRHLALHGEAQTSHVLYRLPLTGDKSERRRVVSALDALQHLSHPHLLRVERFTLEGEAGSTMPTAAWVVTPYTGAQAGLLTLPEHLAAKDDQMSAAEGERAVRHMLEACAAAHEQGIVHGPIDPQRILVDRFGAVRIELFGLDRKLAGLAPANSELVRDELRSVVEFAYRLLTGLDADEHMIPASRLARRPDRRLCDWLTAGLDPAAGFATAREALEMLDAPPMAVREPKADAPARPKPVVAPVRQVLDRFRGRSGTRA